MNEPESLKELAQAVFDNQQASARHIAAKAQKAGRKLSYTTLNHMLAGTYKSTPTSDTLRTLAWLAGISAEVAFTAAGQPVPGPPLADELPDGADNLSPKSRRAVIEMLRVLIDLENASHEGSNRTRTASTTRQEQGHGPATGEEQKTGPAALAQPPAGIDFGLAAHPDMKMAADRTDEHFDHLGEENQDSEGRP